MEIGGLRLPYFELHEVENAHMYKVQESEATADASAYDTTIMHDLRRSRAQRIPFLCIPVSLWNPEHDGLLIHRDSINISIKCTLLPLATTHSLLPPYPIRRPLQVRLHGPLCEG